MGDRGLVEGLTYSYYLETRERVGLQNCIQECVGFCKE